jgi:hypothetical protein
MCDDVEYLNYSPIELLRGLLLYSLAYTRVESLHSRHPSVSLCREQPHAWRL